MTVPHQVLDLLSEHRGSWPCDDCIARALKRPDARDAGVITAAIGNGAGFRRATKICEGCTTEKIVTIAN
jgi:hypothetical protein